MSDADITVTSGDTVTFAEALADGDEVDIVGYGTFSVASLNADNLDSGTVPDARITGAYTGITNLTMSGNLTVDTNTLFVDSANNRVGVGTVSPAEKVDIAGNDANAVSLQIVNSETASASVLLGQAGSSGYGVTSWGSSVGILDGTNGLAIGSADPSAPLLFYTSNTRTERARIDSSGNLLVGTTSGFATISTTASESGHVFNASGGYALARAGAPIYANRTGSDGDIAVFRKDGSTVGSIGVSGGRPFYGADNGSTGSSIQMDSLGTIPRTRTGGSSDGTFNLGASGSRWKDLYLSGGVVFGSTGGAVTGKTLDDYEEGTWTPSVDSGTNTVNEATYTKVGRLVTVSAVLSNFSDTTTASIITISGLPFTVSHQGFGICDGERFDVSLIVAQARTSDSKIALKNGIGSTDFTSVDYADINDGVDVALSFIVTYFTT